MGGTKAHFFLGMEMNIVRTFVRRLMRGGLGQEGTPAALVEVVKGALKDPHDFAVEDS